MAEHPSIRSRTANVVFVRFGRRAIPDGELGARGPTCQSCAHWCGEGGGDSSGYCLADCGARPTTAESRCGEWRRPPLLIVV